MTHGGAQPARTSAEGGPARPLGAGLNRGHIRLLAALLALGAVVFALALVVARAGRTDPAPVARQAAAERLAAPVPVEEARVDASLPSLGTAPKVPDLRRTPAPTGGDATPPATPSTPAPAATSPAPAATSPPPAATSPPPADTSPAPAGTGGGDVICSPC